MLRPQINRPRVPDLAQQQHAQDAKHKGLSLCPHQRVLDLVTREQGEIVSGDFSTDGKGESYQVSLDDPPWLRSLRRDPEVPEAAGIPKTLRLVVRTRAELEPIPGSLRCDLADLENPKL